jgi:small-conductance mechanosensitive channel
VTANPVFPTSLYNLLDFELFILIVNFYILCYLFYRFFLQNVSLERHNSLKNHFKNLIRHICVLSILFALYTLATTYADESLFLRKTTPYLASLTFFSGAYIFVKCFRLFVLQYLFLGSMRAGVPLLLVNIFSLLLSVVIVFWSLSKLFGIDLTPILATSAAFSIVLGLALQDTLGNLFAGISLQVDKTFELGDWIEVQNGLIKIVGQVTELSWRSTVLVGLTDELITLPNKLVASCQVSNFSLEKGPIIRSQLFRLKFNADSMKAKDLIETAISQISDIRGVPTPFAYIQDINENWIAIKAVYYIDDYGKQYVIGDKVFERVTAALKLNGFELAHQVIAYEGTPS